MINRPGFLHVIAGPMFAGKTITLIAEIQRHEDARERVEIFTHTIDNRHRVGNIATHHGDAIEARAFAAIDDLVAGVSEHATVVAIDEAQFFEEALIPAVKELIDRGLHIIISGLCVTFDGQPFEPIPSLMAIADKVDKLVSRCNICDGAAPYHQPLEEAFLSDPMAIRSEQIGGSDIYQARCRKHFTNHPA